MRPAIRLLGAIVVAAAGCGDSTPRRDAAAVSDLGLDAVVPMVDSGSDPALDAALDAADGEPELDADTGDRDAACEPPLVSCRDHGGPERCVDLMTDSCHCGRCNQWCICDAGACELSALPECVGAGAVLCQPPVCVPGGPTPFCADTNNDPAHCGDCYHACTDREVCLSAECVLVDEPDAGADGDSG